MEVSKTHFLADILDSIVCVIDLETDTYKFIEAPFYGSVLSFNFSEDNMYLAYTYATGGDVLTHFIDIVDIDTMTKQYSINLSDYVKAEKNIDEDAFLSTYDSKIEWIDKGLYVSFTYDNESDPDEAVGLEKILVWEE